MRPRKSEPRITRIDMLFSVQLFITPECVCVCMHVCVCVRVCVYMFIICFVNSTLVIHPYTGWRTAHGLAITGNMYNVMTNETINQCLGTPNNENFL